MPAVFAFIEKSSPYLKDHCSLDIKAIIFANMDHGSQETQ